MSADSTWYSYICVCFWYVCGGMEYEKSNELLKETGTCEWLESPCFKAELKEIFFMNELCLNFNLHFLNANRTHSGIDGGI